MVGLRAPSALGDALFPAMLSFAADAGELQRARVRRLVFLARFGRQPLLGWDDVESSEIRLYVDVLVELLREESESAQAQAKRMQAQARQSDRDSA